jgi:alpha-tubulin suppressor-like RCC1 family protein
MVMAGCGSSASGSPGSSANNVKIVGPVLSANYAVCAVTASGHVACLGDGTAGELGDGSTASTPTPKLVSQVASAAAISVGNGTSCAVMVYGGVDCWGGNTNDSLGDDKTSQEQPRSLTPVNVTGITNAIDVSSGGSLTCATLADGSVQCWGAVPVTGHELLFPTPVTIPGITDAESVSVGGAGEACALLRSGKIDCWGDTLYGELGDGVTDGPDRCVNGPCAPHVTQVKGITNAIAVAAGNETVCAIIAGGQVDCSGNNGGGDLGIASDTGPQKCGGGPNGEPCSSVPVRMPGISAATAISVGSDDACVLLHDGTSECWGDNTDGDLGGGPQIGAQSATPVAVVGLHNAKAITAGSGNATCAETQDGRLECWGTLGGVSSEATKTWGATPVAVPGITLTG